MSPVVNIGPLALAADRLTAVGAIWLFIFIATHRRFAVAGGQHAGWAAITGVIAARLAYVAAHAEEFWLEPLAILKFWQGGFLASAGIAVAALYLALTVPKEQRFRFLALLLAISGSWYAVDRLITTSTSSPLAVEPALLRSLDGEPINAELIKGRPYVANLWADWCPPCRREMPLLAEFASRNPDVLFLFVNQGDVGSTAAKLPAEHGIQRSTVLLDETAKLSAAYGGALPTTIFVGPDGLVRAVHTGEIGRAALSEKLKLIKE